MFDVSKKGGLRPTPSFLPSGSSMEFTWSLTKILAWKLCEAVILVWLNRDGSGIGFVGE